MPVHAGDVTLETQLIPGDRASAGGTGFFDVNSGGRIVGTLFDEGDYHAFLRETDGSLTLISVPPNLGFATSGFGINDAGDIVGTYVRDSGRGFLRSASGNISSLHVDGALSTAAFGINNHGDIVGAYQVNATGFGFHGTFGYVRDATGAFRTVAVPDAVYTIASDINDRGQIAGYYAGVNGHRGGFLTDVTGTFTLFDFGDSAGPSMYVGGIDEEGRVVGAVANPVQANGEMLDGFGVFVREPDGAMRFLDLPASVASDYYPRIGINSHGDIVGTLMSTFAPSGALEDVYGFIARPVHPVPLPAAGGLLAVALAALTAWRGRLA